MDPMGVGRESRWGPPKKRRVVIRLLYDLLEVKGIRNSKGASLDKTK